MLKKVSLLIIVALVVYACSSSSENPNNGGGDNFDRGAMLKHLADNIIVPSFEDFNTQLSGLKTAAKNFTSNPTAITLQEVRTSWYNAYKGWQTVAIFNIGKAEELQFVNHFNIYPLNVSDLEKNVMSGTYNLTHSNNHDTQGFPALDYLLYGLADTDTDILAKYNTDANAAKYKDYFTAIVAKMNEVNTAILKDWKDGYATSFATNSGNTATSSLNMFVNDFVYYYEKQLRANKIGIPAGNFSAKPLPEKVEAFYRKNISKELTLIALQTVKNVFLGKYVGNSTASKSGFKAYLEALNKQELAKKIETQWQTATTVINTLDTNYYEQINKDNTKMTQAYDELQKAVVLLKVDMLQAFNVSVDYVDADGD